MLPAFIEPSSPDLAATLEPDPPVITLAPPPAAEPPPPPPVATPVPVIFGPPGSSISRTQRSQPGRNEGTSAAPDDPAMGITFGVPGGSTSEPERPSKSSTVGRRIWAKKGGTAENPYSGVADQTPPPI